MKHSILPQSRSHTPTNKSESATACSIPEKTEGLKDLVKPAALYQQGPSEPDIVLSTSLDGAKVLVARHMREMDVRQCMRQVYGLFTPDFNEEDINFDEVEYVGGMQKLVDPVNRRETTWV